MQGFGAFGQFSQVAVFEGFRECVEEAPDIPPFKGVVPGFPPFLKHFWDQPVGAHAHIRRPDDEVMGFRIRDLRFFVGGNPSVLVVPLGEQQTNRAADQLGQVTHDEPGVFAGELDLT